MPGSRDSYYAVKEEPWGSWVEDPCRYFEEWLEGVRAKFFTTNSPPAHIEYRVDNGYFVVSSPFGDELAFIIRPRSFDPRRVGLSAAQAEYIVHVVQQFNFKHCRSLMEPRTAYNQKYPEVLQCKTA